MSVDELEELLEKNMLIAGYKAVLLLSKRIKNEEINNKDLTSFITGAL